MDTVLDTTVHNQLIKIIILKFTSPVLLAQLAYIFPYRPSSTLGIRALIGSVDLGLYCIRLRTRRGIYGQEYRKEFLRVMPEGTPEGKGVYLTVYPDLSPNTDRISLTDPV